MRAWLAAAGSGWAIVVLLISAIHLAAPQRGGPLALTQVGAPFLFAVLLLFVPLAFASATGRGRTWQSVLRALLVVCLVVGVVRFGPVWVSLPPAGTDGQRIAVTTWNLEASAIDVDAFVARLRDMPPGIVALEELARPPSSLIASDREINACSTRIWRWAWVQARRGVPTRSNGCRSASCASTWS